MNYINPALRKAIASLPCALQLHGCLHSPCAPAHANWSEYGKGRGFKAHDVYCVPACSSCHHELDQGVRLNTEQRRFAWEKAWRQTMLDLFRFDLVVVPGAPRPREVEYRPVSKIVPRSIW